jgi:hypothetical protein
VLIAQEVAPAYASKRRQIISLLMNFKLHFQLSDTVAHGAIVLLDRIVAAGGQV